MREGLESSAVYGGAVRLRWRCPDQCASVQTEPEVRQPEDDQDGNALQEARPCRHGAGQPEKAKLERDQSVEKNPAWRERTRLDPKMDELPPGSRTGWDRPPGSRRTLPEGDDCARMHGRTIRNGKVACKSRNCVNTRRGCQDCVRAQAAVSGTATSERVLDRHDGARLEFRP